MFVSFQALRPCVAQLILVSRQIPQVVKCPGAEIHAVFHVLYVGPLWGTKSIRDAQSIAHSRILPWGDGGGLWVLGLDPPRRATPAGPLLVESCRRRPGSHRFGQNRASSAQEAHERDPLRSSPDSALFNSALLSPQMSCGDFGGAIAPLSGPDFSRALEAPHRVVARILAQSCAQFPIWRCGLRQQNKNGGRRNNRDS